MRNKQVAYLLAIVAASYAAIYVYQRYKRKKANDSVVSYEEAIKVLDGI